MSEPQDEDKTLPDQAASVVSIDEGLREYLIDDILNQTLPSVNVSPQNSLLFFK